MEGNNLVTIIGRTNVGKSCLFNRLLSRRQSIVDKKKGITRDRIYAPVKWGNKKFQLCDTAGWPLGDTDQLGTLTLEQVKKAIEDADLILFMVDAGTGLVSQDQQILDLLRPYSKKIMLVVNKVDNPTQFFNYSEFHELGVEPICFVSALHGLNIDELLDAIINALKFNDYKPEESTRQLKIAIVGRPNVGKSSFLNKIVNENRVIVDSQPGTTRDSIDTHIDFDNKKLLLIDTAGIKRRKKTRQELEIYARSRTLQAIKKADVCLMLIDAQTGIGRNDLHIFDLIKKESKCCVIVINKCDLVKLSLADAQQSILYKAPFIRYAYVVLCSARTGKNLTLAIKLAQRAWQNSSKKIGQNQLNDFLYKISNKLKPRRIARRLKVSYLMQVKTAPPKFILFVNEKKLVRIEFLRFIEERLRQNFDFKGSPITLIAKNKK